MIGFVGNLLLLFALLSCLALMIYATLYKKNLNNKYKYVFLAAIAQFLFVLFSYILLTYGYIISDFSLKNVWQNSEINGPVIYKITGVWGNHEGSMLLWVLTLTAHSFFVVLFGKSIPRKTLVNILAVQALITFAFLIFVVITSNPFILQYPIPNDGLGLNSLLQDPGLIIHPPLLYLGYVGYSLVFSFAVAAMLDNSRNKDWVRWVEKWAYLSWCSLTLGIIIGSYWAYYELGWGGWWFWDPVENASLLPWLTGTALMHSMLVYKTTGFHRDWTLLLAILTFLFSILGTFLVRSGILTSVHSFANDPDRGIIILLIMSFFAVSSLLLFVTRLSDSQEKVSYNLFGRETFILYNNSILVLSCFMVLFGTMYPLILETLMGHKITVGPQYFNTVFTPITILIALILPIGQNTNWHGSLNPDLLKRLFISILITISILIIIQITLLGTTINLSIFIIGLGVLIVCSSIMDLFDITVDHKYGFFDAITNNIKNIKIRSLGSRLAHCGLGFLIIGVVYTSTFQLQKELLIDVGDEVRLDEFILKYKKISTSIGENYDDLILDFELFNDKKKIGDIRPAKRFFRNSGNITTESGIHRHYFDHIFINVGEVNEKNVLVSVSHKPLIRLIWLGGFMMVFGAFFSVCYRYRN
tara:strand:- start:10579 stop:12510 length:1932 start_codon:yes stop_codon:yes gene_type:complete